MKKLKDILEWFSQFDFLNCCKKLFSFLLFPKSSDEGKSSPQLSWNLFKTGLVIFK